MSKYCPQLLIALLLICLSNQMGLAATWQTHAHAEAALERYRQIGGGLG